MGEFDSLLGTMLLGTLFNTLLYGVVTTQYASYHTTKFRDPRWIRTIVGCLFVLDTAQTAVSIYFAYFQLVTHFADPENILILSLAHTWPFSYTFTSNVINATLAQSILTYRINRLTKNRLLTSALSFLLFTVLIMGLTACIRGFIVIKDGNREAIAEQQTVIIAWRVLEVVLDLSLSGILIFVLHRARTGFNRTETIINSIVGHAIKTGVFLSVYSVVNAATLLSAPGVQAAFVYSQGKVATNTLLTTLLRRQDFKNLSGDGQTSTSIFNHNNHTTSRSHGATATNNIELHVRREIQTTVHTGGGPDDAVTEPGTDQDSENVNFKTRGIVSD